VEQARWLRESGIRIHGETSDLLPGDADAEPLPPVDEAEVAAAAVATFANFAVTTHRQRRRTGEG
jgi:hypothetical protein